MVSKQLLFVLMALFFLQLSATCLARVEKMKKNDEGRGRAVNKFSHGSIPGASGGRGARNGGSHVPTGGGGVTPLYAAAGAGAGGGTNNHHPHRGEGNRGTSPETLAIITFACFLILFCIN
ncbi:hypothetical protein SASPL_101277 [Salvia splendens]|uniref:Uncharacterized protein n=1 Tax=Salvia splendens TaxID=180675 RepID=A0A8X8YNZ8_SALSN|nr:hypothetical protein SASPL_101277 [Salvia splendens]